MSTSSYRIQWKDDNHNKQGSFECRYERHKSWQSPSECPLSAGSYDFYLSVSEGVNYTTFISLTQAGNFSRGARVPDTMHDNTSGENDGAILLGPLDVQSGTIDVEASYLVSDDPKVVVTWGKGQGNATVELTWNGSRAGWTTTPAMDANCQIFVDSQTAVDIKVTDASDNRSVAAVYEILPDGNQAEIDDWCNLAPPHDDDHTFTMSQPSGNSQTTYTVNLFNTMQSGATLTVR